MVTPFWRLVASYWLPNRLVVDVLLRTLKPTQTVIVLRIRYAEDRLQEAISSGVQQYVILGAGLDTFALRHPSLADRLRIYEVDHPASQEMKRHQLGRIGHVAPESHIGAGGLRDGPARRCVDRGRLRPRRHRRSLRGLGVTCYLTREAVSDTIGQIAAVAAPESRVVLDYRYPRRLVPAAGLALVEKMDRFVERRGEPMLSEYSPDEIDAEMKRAGFTAMDHVSPAEQTQRYLQDRNDIPEPPPQLRVRTVQEAPLD